MVPRRPPMPFPADPVPILPRGYRQRELDSQVAAIHNSAKSVGA